MSLCAPFTDLMSIEHPIALAPMGGSAGGSVVAAVSNGGGLGLLGAGRDNRAWLERELAIVAARTGKPWGIGFLTWAIIDGRGADTERTRVLDRARGSDWPEKYSARVLRNAFLDRWRNREEEVAHDDEARRVYGQAVDDNDINVDLVQ